MSNTFWIQRREPSLNWLALGLLLAAWNAVEDPGSQDTKLEGARLEGPRLEGPGSRPESLRGYAFVSVRAAARSTGHCAVNKL
jgi:hypothetical protein